MKKIMIVNRRDPKSINRAHEMRAIIVYIGRGSALGNPFHIDHHIDREMAIALYEAHARDMLKKGGNDFTREFKKIQRSVEAGQLVALECYCYPRRCHGEVIRKLIEERINESITTNTLRSEEGDSC